MMFCYFNAVFFARLRVLSVLKRGNSYYFLKISDFVKNLVLKVQLVLMYIIVFFYPY